MNFRNLSITRKLTLLAVLTTTMAVMLTSASFLIYDLITFRSTLRQDLMTDAEIVAYNSAAALAFNDEPAAEVQLAALTAKSDLVAALLYDADGRVFARYYRGGIPTAELPKPVDGKLSRVSGSDIEVFNDVSLRGERLGTLYLRSDMQRWHTRARQYAGILVIFVMISGLLAWVVSSKLQRVVSRPILDLEQTMRRVSVDKNYAIRAVRTSGDETGRLINGFNTMLAEIQQRDKALQRANNELKTRTQELEDEIVHRKHTQEELLKAKDAAEEASRAKSAFLANMSHELRTPLNAIIGYSEILEEDIRDSGEENIRDLHRIQNAAKHLLTLINDVLDFSKIEAGKMALHLETFEVEPLLEEIFTTLRPAAQHNGNQLALIVTGGTGAMHADITKVRQILLNLLSNACKFTENGTVTLQAIRQRTDAGDRLSFRITDTGIGMSPEQQQHLFQYFSQADSSTARKYGGTGLGLAISLRFTHMMGGDIHVVSELGAGSTFTLELPAEVVVEAPEGAAQPEAPVAALALSGAH